MKKRVLLFTSFFLLSALASCGKKKDEFSKFYNVDAGNGEFEKTEMIKDEGIEIKKQVQNGTILHAWNWSLENIKNNMAAIAQAGYTAVQTSPLQPQKDYIEGENQANWWKLYQPLGLCIAEKGQNALGTKEELKEVCAEADKYGVKVIVDVVANHLAGGTSTTLNEDVKKYEPEIYKKNLIHTKGSIGSANDSVSVTTCAIGGYPDLDTSSSIVQNRVLSLLKSYIDCGVDGFRFDAAKHIETPQETKGNQSDFWTVVLNGTTSYAQKKKNITPYYYGEILNTVGDNRKFEWYTSIMSITDNKTGNQVREALGTYKSTNSAANGKYYTEQAADKIVLWGESHDTYAENQSNGNNQETVNKAYALMAARNGASSLYFARPTEGAIGSKSVLLGDIGTNYWQSKQIKAVNDFHNYFDGANETISSSNDVILGYRENDKAKGLVLVNNSSSNNITVNVPQGMSDGKYKDHVSGKEIDVVNGTVNFEIDNSGIAVLVNYDVKETEIYDKPSLEASVESGKYAGDSLEVSYNIKNAESAYIQYENGPKKEIKNNAKLTISGVEIGTISKVKVVVKGLDKTTISKTYNYKKYDPQSEMTVYFKNTTTQYTSHCEGVSIYLWNAASDANGNADSETKWPGTAMNFLKTDADGRDIYYYEIDISKYDRMIFNNNGNNIQSIDITIDKTKNLYELTEGNSKGVYQVKASTYSE